MGLLDRFKNNDKKVDMKSVQKEQSMDGMRYSRLENGNLQVDFYDVNADFNKFYDITRLVISSKPINLGGQEVYNCAVSWYGENDCQVPNRKGQLDSMRAQSYRGVLVELNMELLQNDPEYCKVLMSLLDKQRVERYLADGLQDDPKLPCGKYIGGVQKTDKGYGKFFSAEVGKASHYSKLMVDRRQELKARKEAQKQATMEEIEAQIEELQKKLESMER